MQVKLEGVKKIYGSRTVLDLEELIVEEGCLFGIITNGAGKSTCGTLWPVLMRRRRGSILRNRPDRNNSLPI